MRIVVSSEVTDVVGKQVPYPSFLLQQYFAYYWKIDMEHTLWYGLMQTYMHQQAVKALYIKV